MDFFGHQDQARRRTGRLIALMVLAVSSLIVITTIIASIAITAIQHSQFGLGYNNDLGLQIDYKALLNIDWRLIGAVAFIVIGGIVLTSALKAWQLRTGGSAVAKALGGVKIDPATAEDPLTKRAYNLVEEMALAANLPMPEVYILNDEAINAFAAGHSPEDAAIGLTRGAITLLTRDELQSVIAHEFSHVLEGDMRLNTRLVCAIHGLLFIGTMGHLILRVSALSNQKSNKSAGAGGVWPMALLGVVIIAIGFAGTLFGRLIQAAVSRQREFLADASAVQFTRNPRSIASALRKIESQSISSPANPQAAQFQHMMFSSAASRWSMTSWFATHPPIDERVSRLQPTRTTSAPK